MVRLSQAELKKSMRKVFVISTILLVFASIACVSGVEYSANVIAEDTIPPIVTDPSANPSSIAADGVQESQLNVTVTDESGIFSVTVDLTSVGGPEAKEMVKIDLNSNIYTTTTTASVGTPPGTYYLQVNATDNSTNRNSNTSACIQLAVTAPAPVTYAIWANSTKGNAIQWSGSRNVVNGGVHSNNGIRVSGSSNIINGTTEYVSTFTDSGSNNTFIPPPIKVSPEPFPIQYNVADYKPGGKKAVAAEAEGKYHYFDKNFHVSDSDVVLDGLYYVEGDVKFKGNNISGVFTIVAEKKIDVSGSEHNCSAYCSNLLLLAGKEKGKGKGEKIKIAVSNSNFCGVIYTEKGKIEISGSENTLNGDLFADTVKLSVSESNIDAAHLDLKSTIGTTQTSGDNISIFIKAFKAILRNFYSH